MTEDELKENWSISGKGDYRSDCGHPRWFISQDQATEEPYCEKCHCETRELWYQEQLTAAEEQLAEMRELVVEAKAVMYVRGYRRWTNRADEALSAAPKRGRVLWEEEVETSFDGVVRFWEYDKAGDRSYMGELNEPIADWAFDGKPKIVTVREAEDDG